MGDSWMVTNKDRTTKELIAIAKESPCFGTFNCVMKSLREKTLHNKPEECPAVKDCAKAFGIQFLQEDAKTIL